MAIIDDNTQFNADTLGANVIGIAADVGKHDSGTHEHEKGQLLYAPQGCMTLALDDSICILPPTKAVWIPPHTFHRAIMTNVVAYRSIYFNCSEYLCPTKLVTIEVNDLLKALIDKMALWDWDIEATKTQATTALFWEEFHQAKQFEFNLPLPSDRRLSSFRRSVMKDGFSAPELTLLSRTVGASSKTITRLFKAETGMSYQDWRQQWRLFKAIELLCEGRQVSDVAHCLMFSSDSAFIAFFKKQTGQTPLSFMKHRALL